MYQSWRGRPKRRDEWRHRATAPEGGATDVGICGKIANRPGSLALDFRNRAVAEVPDEQRRRAKDVLRWPGSAQRSAQSRASRARDADARPTATPAGRGSAKSGSPFNTSFNENEPIVNAPEHAYACYARTSMDMLVMENCVVRRS